MPRPTSRGCRTHQKVSTSAANCGTRRRSCHGRKSSTRAAIKESTTVLTRAGIRMWRELSGPIAVLFPRLRAARLLTPILALLRFFRARGAHRVVGEHQEVAAAVDSGDRLAHHVHESL